MLDRLPPELLLGVLQEVTKWDLKSLSLVSKHIHAAVATILWQSITLQPKNEWVLHDLPVYEFRRELLKTTTRLHFESEFRDVTTRRCVHNRDEEFTESLAGDDEYYDSDDVRESYFERLGSDPCEILDYLQPDQLRSFSWNLGTCIPEAILGSKGDVVTKHPSLKCLKLTTDPSCNDPGGGNKIFLSSFRHLESFSWRAPNGTGDVRTLSDAIQSNSKHLRVLELDFIDWQNFLERLGYDDSDDEDFQRDFFEAEILRLDEQPFAATFPALRELSLTQVSLTPAVALAINSNALKSLKIRECPGWDHFLRRLGQIRPPIRLKTLEVQDSLSYQAEDYAVGEFLEASEGLEELFVTGTLHSESNLAGWGCLRGHESTLTRFVQHQYGYSNNQRVGNPELRQISENPSQHPFARFNLECIGLTCAPERLERILLPFTTKSSLKLLHIRQSSSDLQYHKSLALRTPEAGTEASNEQDGTDQSSAAGTTSDNAEPSGHSRPTGMSRLLRSEFLSFAEWAFGPQGIRSLDIVAHGDFAHGGRTGWNNLILLRSGDGENPFNLLAKSDRRWQDVLHRYRDVLEACPEDSLLNLPKLSESQFWPY